MDEKEAAAIVAEAAAYENAGSGHAAEQEDDDSAAEPNHARPHPPSTGTSVFPSISEEHASEESQEEYSDNDGFLYHRENDSRHGHQDRDAYFPDDRMGEEGDHQPSMFRAAAQTDARDFFKGAQDLSFPSYAPGARWLEETTTNALVQGQVIPKLQFDHMSSNSWDSLRDKPLGFYVVGATNAGNNTTMLMLAHEYGGTAYLPPIVFIEYILVLSDTVLAGELVGKAVLNALTKNGRITSKSPSNPRENGGAGASTSGKLTDAASVKGELNPLLRLLHNDQQKLAKLTNGDATIKVSNLAIFAKIKVHQLESNIEDLPNMQTQMLTKLLAMNACAQINYNGVGSKADAAWHIAHLLKMEKNGVTLPAFKSMKDFQEFIDTIEKYFCVISLVRAGTTVRFSATFSGLRVKTSTMRPEKPKWMISPRTG